MYIRTRSDLIKWLENNAPRRAIARALQEGQVEHLGGFEHIPPSTLPGWIVKVTSVHNKMWRVVVLANDTKHRYESRIIESVPWKNWSGTNFWSDESFRDKLFSGDKPEEYKRLRDNEK